MKKVQSIKGCKFYAVIDTPRGRIYKRVPKKDFYKCFRVIIKEVV